MPSAVLNIVDKREEPENEPDVVEQSEIVQNEIQLLVHDGTVVAIDIEEYVYGVVLAEMPASFEAEALKAQAVLARTYALKHSNAGSKHINAAVCTESSCCQGYQDPDASALEDDLLDKVKRAVMSTEGQVLVYNNELIEATYFSCSGGRTEDAVAVWGVDVPYLQATDSPGEESSTHFLTTLVITQKECAANLGINGGNITVGQARYTDGGGVASIEINGHKYTGVQIRQLLGLKSTAFRMNVIGSNVVITVKGYGHRVGMSQYGADAMAATGSDYKEILAHYYSGTVLTKEFC